MDEGRIIFIQLMDGLPNYIFEKCETYLISSMHKVAVDPEPPHNELIATSSSAINV